MAGDGIVVTDSSVLIALTACEQTHILGDLFEAVLVPLAVLDELLVPDEHPEADEVVGLPNVKVVPTISPPPPETAGLGRGEAQVIAVAAAHPEGQAVALVDEKLGRSVAAGLGVPLMGTVGLLIHAKQRGLVDELRPLLQRLVDREFRLSAALVEGALRKVGEAD